MSKEMRIEGSHVAPVVKALSNDVRLKILSLLSDGDMNVQNIAAQLGPFKDRGVDPHQPPGAGGLHPQRVPHRHRGATSASATRFTTG